MFLKLLPMVCAAAALVAAAPADAAEHTVQMLNRGPGGAMVFSPSVVQARPDETEHRLATVDPGLDDLDSAFDQTVTGHARVPLGEDASAGRQSPDRARGDDGLERLGVETREHFRAPQDFDVEGYGHGAILRAGEGAAIAPEPPP